MTSFAWRKKNPHAKRGDCSPVRTIGSNHSRGFIAFKSTIFSDTYLPMYQLEIVVFYLVFSHSSCGKGRIFSDKLLKNKDNSVKISDKL